MTPSRCWSKRPGAFPQNWASRPSRSSFKVETPARVCGQPAADSSLVKSYFTCAITPWGLNRLQPRIEEGEKDEQVFVSRIHQRVGVRNINGVRGRNSNRA